MGVKRLLILSLAILLLCGCSKKEVSTNQKEVTKDFTFRNDILFDTHTNDYIYIKGKDITLDGSNAYMEADINKDEINEKFTIRLGNPKGTEIMYYNEKTCVNLLDLIVNDPLKNSSAFDDREEPNEDYYFQLSCYDLDHDGVKEIILSLGDMSADETSLIYRVSDFDDIPVIYVGAAYGLKNMYISPENHIYAPYGTAGLLNDYIYKDDKLYEAVD